MVDTETSPFTPRALLAILALSIYVFMGWHSIYWLADATDFRMGSDFSVYFTALTKAQSNQNPYLAEKMSKSLLYHPFSLVFLSPISWLGIKGAMFTWTVLSVVAWALTILLLIRLTNAEDAGLNGRWVVWTIWGIFFAFAPFWETLYLGQINAFVILLLVLTIYFHEQERPNLAGIFLGLAIVLKLSPVILLPFFLVLRQYRIIAVSLITLAVLTIVAAAQFGWPVVESFLNILPVLSAEIRPTKHNQSVLSLSYRVLGLFTDIGMRHALIQFHKVLFAGVLGVLLVVGLQNKAWTGRTRLWLFGTLVVLVTISSPLVWYHHSIFLVVPLLILMRHKRQVFLGLSLLIIVLIQGNRLFELHVDQYAVPAFLAHLSLMGMMVAILIKEVMSKQKKLIAWLAIGYLPLLVLTGMILRDDDGVLLIQTLRQALAPTEPVAADFGLVTLEGYRVDLTRLNARSQIYLTTFWKPTDLAVEVSSRFPIKVFVHLRNDSNKNVAQSDHVLFGDAGDPQPFTGYLAILSGWDLARAGNDPLRDDTIITIPADLPADTYRLFVGLYDPNTLDRYQILNDSSGENAAPLGRVEIKTN